MAAAAQQQHAQRQAQAQQLQQGEFKQYIEHLLYREKLGERGLRDVIERLVQKTVDPMCNVLITGLLQFAPAPAPAPVTPAAAPSAAPTPTSLAPSVSIPSTTPQPQQQQQLIMTPAQASSVNLTSLNSAQQQILLQQMLNLSNQQLLTAGGAPQQQVRTLNGGSQYGS